MRRETKNAIAISLGAAGAGAGLMFLLDPVGGRTRRGLMNDRAVHTAKVLEKSLQSRGRNLGNRARGIAAETMGRVISGRPTDDQVLTERVRSKIGRAVSHPSAIEVSAERGMVTLRGAVLRSEMRRLLREANAARGVAGIRHDELRAFADAEGIPGFRQGSNRTQSRGETRAEKQPRRFRSLRLLLGAASGAIAAYKAVQSNSRRRKSHPTESTSEQKAA